MAKDDHDKDDGPPPKRRRGKPPVIELAATEIEPSPQAASAPEPEPAAPEHPSERERPVLGKAWFGVLDRAAVRFVASIAVTALAGALIAISVVLLFDSGADMRLARLAGEVAQLNARVAALANRPADGTAAALGERMERVTASLVEVERRLAAVERRAPPPLPDIAPLAARIGAMEAELQTLRQETAERLRFVEERLANLAVASRATVSPTLAAEIVALNMLREALSAGAPFTAELAAARALLGDRAAALAALAPAAANGVPTTAALARRFSELAPQLTRAPASGFFDRLAQSASNLVDVRRAGEEPAGDDVASVAARVQARLERGDLAGAIDAAEKSPAFAEGPAGEWLKAAKLRLAADAALKTLIETSLASLAAEAKRP